MRRILERLGYELVPGGGKGSHRKYAAAGRQTLTYAYDDGDEIGANMVKLILVRSVGLTPDEARKVVRDA